MLRVKFYLTLEDFDREDLNSHFPVDTISRDIRTKVEDFPATVINKTVLCQIVCDVSAGNKIAACQVPNGRPK